MSNPPGPTPLMRQYEEIKRQYPDTLVLFRMGDFFETFNEDAKITSRILGIVLTKRSNGAAADTPLAGFPHHALDTYLPKLVKAGYRVAICEQVEDPKLAKGIVKREVVEVVTPGTLTTDRTGKSNQYIAALHFEKDRAGFACYDPATGEFFLGECPNDQLVETLRKFAPREVVVAESVTYSTAPWYRELRPFVTKVEDGLFHLQDCLKRLQNHFQTVSLKGFGVDRYPLGLTAAGVLFAHNQDTLNSPMDHVLRLRPVTREGIMILDGFTVRNLELFQSLITQGTHGTLLDILDQTTTSGGSRLLRQWLMRPLAEKASIDERLEIVAALVKEEVLLADLRDRLKRLVDMERVLSRISMGKAHPKDVSALGTTLQALPDIRQLLERIEGSAVTGLVSDFEDTDAVAAEILNTLDPDPPVQIGKSPTIAAGIHPELDELRTLLQGGKEWLRSLQEKERERLQIPSLKVGFNKVFGYYLEVTKAHLERVPATYIRKQTLVNSERYITPELKEYEEKILTAEERILTLETELFYDLCRSVLRRGAAIQKNSEVLNRLDVLSTFAHLARHRRYCRPVMVDEPILELKDNRHPVVETLLPASDRFIPNDVSMDAAKNQIQLITGPNMAGKSTYLRQIGLTVVMAQMGSFVPASSARIGVVDKLFTRVGASDNLAGGESTFLVEMNEAANILNNATRNSLILLDEIGRGTATYDGLSLAWAITEYLH
ncbi:MAG: DNA mismatch repair protein MutS, partial [Candidatus Neomarinimicrobiota bacterium]